MSGVAVLATFMHAEKTISIDDSTAYEWHVARIDVLIGVMPYLNLSNFPYIVQT